MVGYGRYGVGSTGAYLVNGVFAAGGSDNQRRIGQSELGDFEEGSSGQDFFMAQFRNPNSPGNPDVFGLNALGIATLPLEAGVAQGDSGGPLFVCYAPNGTPINGTLNAKTGLVACNSPNQLVQIGEVQGGSGGVCTAGPAAGMLCPNAYGEQNNWTPVQMFSGWLAQYNPLRFVTAAGGNYNWNDPTAWVDSVLGANNVVPNNTSGLIGTGIAPATNSGNLYLGSYYQVALANPGTITLNISPTIDTLSVAGAQSQLTRPMR
jgi:hypothetical protein